MIEIDLPYPPSANSYYRHPTKGALAGRHLISAEGRKYRLKIMEMVRPLNTHMPGRLAVTLTCHMPDRRRRDLGNVEKALCDALTHAGLWYDDSQIDDLRIIRAPVVAGGRVTVRVEQIGGSV